MSLFLSPAELVELTDRQTAPAQSRRLKTMGIRHLYKPGGRVKVSREHVPILRSDRPTQAAQQAEEPDFSMFSVQG